MTDPRPGPGQDESGPQPPEPVWAPTQPGPQYGSSGYEPPSQFGQPATPEELSNGPTNGSNEPTNAPNGPNGPNAPDAPDGPEEKPVSIDQPEGVWGPVAPYTQPYTQTRSRSRGAKITLLAVGCLLVGALGGVAGGALLGDVNEATGRNPTITLPEPVSGTAPAGAVTKIADAVLPSVVSIKVATSTESGTGSGFVIDAANGYILTNNHVVTAGGGTKAAGDIRVIFQDGTQVTGKVVGLDASYDLAVVKVQAKGLRSLQLGDSDQVRVGDPVVAVGAPLGLQGTVTTGIVSALNRPVAAGENGAPAFINAIQTDAAINPGNSGGPLVDGNGRVIAVNSAIARSTGDTGDTGGSIGLGFAIPSNQARRTAQELIRTGKAEHPIIGATLDESYSGEGVKVTGSTLNGRPPVVPGGPADKAGIKAGDVITKFNGRPVTESQELIVAIRARTPGETVTLTVLRGGSEREVRVKLSATSD